MYKVIHTFRDTDGKVYKKDDTYNSDDENRIKTLSTTQNRYNKVYIVEIGDVEEESESFEAVEGFDVSDMTVAHLKSALDQLGVKYKSSAKRDDLVQLLEDTHQKGD